MYEYPFELAPLILTAVKFTLNMQLCKVFAHLTGETPYILSWLSICYFTSDRPFLAFKASGKQSPVQNDSDDVC